MQVKIKVLSAKVEKRDLVGKDGNRRNFTITHIVGLHEVAGQEPEVMNCKSFDEKMQLPKAGQELTINFRKYDNSSGVADVFI